MKNGIVDNNNEAAEIADFYKEAADRSVYPQTKSARYEQAAKWFEVAAMCSIGHGRTQRYYEAANYCRTKAKE